MLTLDHLAVSATRLDDGVAHVERALGVVLAPGGKHELMSTHNRLLSLGPGLYLEVIAIDPEAPPVAHPRWFDLDRFDGEPRLTNWIARCDDLPAAIAAAPNGVGRLTELARGDLRWQMAVPDDGCLPFGGTYPALIRWYGSAHPAARLPDAGIRLARLELTHPQVDRLRAALAGQIDDARLSFREGASPRLRAAFHTPGGERWL